MYKDFYKIEEVAEKTGHTRRTLRYYEEIGLISPIRSDLGYRQYSREDVDKIERIREIKGSIGYSHSEIKDMLELEMALNMIRDGAFYDAGIVKNSMAEIKRQIDLVADKENRLQKVKTKLNEILLELVKLNGETTDEA